MEGIFNRTIFFLFSFFFSLRCLSASKCEHSVKRHKENNVRMADKASIQSKITPEFRMPKSIKHNYNAR